MIEENFGLTAEELEEVRKYDTTYDELDKKVACVLDADASTARMLEFVDMIFGRYVMTIRRMMSKHIDDTQKNLVYHKKMPHPMGFWYESFPCSMRPIPQATDLPVRTAEDIPLRELQMEFRTRHDWRFDEFHKATIVALSLVNTLATTLDLPTYDDITAIGDGSLKYVVKLS